MGKYPLREVVAGACALYRINDSKVIKDNAEKIVTSKQRLQDHFAGKDTVDITDADRTAAEECIQAIEHRTMVLHIAGREPSDFFASVSGLLCNETVAANRFGFVVWIPKVVDSIRAEDQEKINMAAMAMGSQYQGTVGDKIEIDFHPIRIKWAHEYSCFRHFGHDGNGNLIGFLNKKEVSGKIKGKVKSQQVSKYQNNARVTYLNYVKEINNGS